MKRFLLVVLLSHCNVAAPPPSAAPVSPVVPKVAEAAPRPPLPLAPEPPPSVVAPPAVVAPPSVPPPAAAPVAPAPPPPAAPSISADPLVARLLASGGPALKAVLAEPVRYRFQVLYGAVGTDKPTLERRGFRADAEYFFPASSMKVPIALATFDRVPSMRRVQAPSLTRDAVLHIHPLAGGGEPYVTTLARETWRALIVSDNASANRLLGITGHREVHESVWGLGLGSVRIHSGFATGAELDPAESSPEVEVFSSPRNEVIAKRKSDLVVPPTAATGLAIGQAAIVDGRRVEGPLSFADKNAVSLQDLQNTLVRIMRPELLPRPSKELAASATDIEYLRQALGTLPSESGIAGYDRNVVADYQLDPFLRGIERVKGRGHFRVFVKVGQAFGFLVTNAYVVDSDTGRAFFLTAAVYANPDETMNDDKYAYETVSFPVLADVAEVFCRHAFAP